MKGAYQEKMSIEQGKGHFYMPQPQSHLLIDADDTLWENNIYFEQAIHSFITFLAHSILTAKEVRIVLETIERTAGYGSASFTASLEKTYRRLAERHVSDEDIALVRRFGEQIIEQPLILLHGVQETLHSLASHYDLIMLTKGDPDEQYFKVERWG